MAASDVPSSAAAPGSLVATSPVARVHPELLMDSPSLEMAPRSLGRGMGFGVTAACLAVMVWFLVVLGTQTAVGYLAVGVGAAIGWAVSRGARRGGGVVALVAGALTCGTLLAGYYLIDRFLLIRRGYIRLTGDPSIPLRPSGRLLRDVLQIGFAHYPAQYIYGTLATVAACWVAACGADNLASRP